MQTATGTDTRINRCRARTRPGGQTPSTLVAGLAALVSFLLLNGVVLPERWISRGGGGESGSWRVVRYVVSVPCYARPLSQFQVLVTRGERGGTWLCAQILGVCRILVSFLHWDSGVVQANGFSMATLICHRDCKSAKNREKFILILL